MRRALGHSIGEPASPRKPSFQAILSRFKTLYRPYPYRHRPNAPNAPHTPPHGLTRPHTAIRAYTSARRLRFRFLRRPGSVRFGFRFGSVEMEHGGRSCSGCSPVEPPPQSEPPTVAPRLLPGCRLIVTILVPDDALKPSSAPDLGKCTILK